MRRSADGFDLEVPAICDCVTHVFPGCVESEYGSSPERERAMRPLLGSDEQNDRSHSSRKRFLRPQAVSQAAISLSLAVNRAGCNVCGMSLSGPLRMAL